MRLYIAFALSALLSACTTSDRPAREYVTGVSGQVEVGDRCYVSPGTSYRAETPRQSVVAVTYAPPEAFTDAFSERVGQTTSWSGQGATWSAVTGLGDDEPFDIRAYLLQDEGGRNNVVLTGTSPDGSDAFANGIGADIFRIAQSVLASAPERFGCTNPDVQPTR